MSLVQRFLTLPMKWAFMISSTSMRGFFLFFYTILETRQKRGQQNFMTRKIPRSGLATWTADTETTGL